MSNNKFFASRTVAEKREEAISQQQEEEEGIHKYESTTSQAKEDGVQRAVKESTYQESWSEKSVGWNCLQEEIICIIVFIEDSNNLYHQKNYRFDHHSLLW